MKLCRCPVCHSSIHLDALIEDDAGRELLALSVKIQPDVYRALISYIALFRPSKSHLSNARALSLVNEVLALYSPSPALAAALSATAERIKAKRATGDKKPLTNHSYLSEVYKTTSKQLSTSGSSGNGEARAVVNDKDAYFERMIGLGIDAATLPGGADYLARKGVKK